MLNRFVYHMALSFLLLSNALCFATPKQLVIFGDSYSDNGNVYAASKNTYPGQAYYLGHFLDGLS
jgi:phospholipase/lecithinase/hemolysin